jgi:hypothetical protein
MTSEIVIISVLWGWIIYLLLNKTEDKELDNALAELKRFKEKQEKEKLVLGVRYDK